MGKRLNAFRQRIGEARELSRFTIDRFKYVGVYYWGRLSERSPVKVPAWSAAFRISAGDGQIKIMLRTNGADWGVMRGVFRDKEYSIPLAVGPVQRIMDVGANAGYASLFFAQQYPSAEILAIEPVPWNVHACRRNFQINGCQATIIEAAVAREDGEAQLLLTGHDSCESLTPVHPWKKKMSVKTMRIESIMKNHGWDDIDLLKVDIEGYEKDLFHNSPEWLGKVGTIVIELHGDYTSADFQRDIQDYGFLVHPLSDGYEKTFIASKQTACGFSL